MPWLQDVDPLTPELAVSILTLHRTYYLVDVMLLYTLLLVVSPLALLLLTTGAPGWCCSSQAGCGSSSSGSRGGPGALDDRQQRHLPGLRLAGVVLRGMVIGYHRSRIWRILGRVPPLLAILVLGALAPLPVQLHLSDGALLAGCSGPRTARPGRPGGAVREGERPGGAPAGRRLSLLYLALTHLWGLAGAHRLAVDPLRAERPLRLRHAPLRGVPGGR